MPLVRTLAALAASVALAVLALAAQPVAAQTTLKMNISVVQTSH
jgi:hypothetical protein